MSALLRLKADNVKSVSRDATAPTYGRNVDGYGSKIPTVYRITCNHDGRTRRVYVYCYSNSGSSYVVISGENYYLSSDVEHMLENLSQPSVCERG